MEVGITEAIGAILLGYLVGSISFANLMARHFADRELMELHRDGAGASTVYRACGPRAALVVFLGDFGKGAVAVLLVEWLMSPRAAMLAGPAAVVGNNWPIFYRFKGGRGVAAAAGSLVPLLPFAMGLGLALAALAFFFTRNMLIASFSLFCGAVALGWVFAYPMTTMVYGMALPGMVAAYTYLARRRVPLGERWRTTFTRPKWLSRNS